MSFYQWEQSITLQQVMEGDLLDFVDRMLEKLGKRKRSYTTLTVECIVMKIVDCLM